MTFGAETVITVGAVALGVGMFVGRVTAAADHAARMSRMPPQFTDAYRTLQRARFGYADGYAAPEAQPSNVPFSTSTMSGVPPPRKI